MALLFRIELNTSTTAKTPLQWSLLNKVRNKTPFLDQFYDFPASSLFFFFSPPPMEKDLLQRLILPPVFWILSLLPLPRILLFLYPAFPNKYHLKLLFTDNWILSPFILSYHKKKIVLWTHAQQSFMSPTAPGLSAGFQISVGCKISAFLRCCFLSQPVMMELPVLAPHIATCELHAA